MSFLLFLVLLAVGFAGFQLWRIQQALTMISACIGFDEVKKAGMLEEIRASAQQQLEAAARGRT